MRRSDRNSLTRFFDRQDPTNPRNGTAITNVAELRHAFLLPDDRAPFFAELVGENGFKLLVGIAKDEGCVQYGSTDGLPPYLMAVACNDGQRSGEMSFLIGNTETPVPLRYCLPIDTVLSIAEEFMRSGRRAPLVGWEEL
jgi:hypothetical protein